MLFSLLLLAAFLLWFLRREWADEVAALQREGNLLLVKSVRNIEGETLDRFLFKQVRIAGTDTVISEEIHGLPKMRDSIKMIAVVNDKETFIHPFGSDDNDLQKAGLERDVKIVTKGDQTTGALSVMLSLKKLPGNDSLGWKMADTSLVASRLSMVFGDEIKQSGLPVAYDIQRSHFDSLQDDPGSITYYDLASGEKFDIVLSEYSGFILLRVWPQILFAVLLFVMIALAFFLIYQNLKRQQQLTEIKNDFIRNITHELKTPVATVSVAIEALQHFGAMDNPERAREYLAISGSELNRLSLLIDKVLRMSLFEDGETTLKKESFDFKLLVEEIIASMRLQFEKYQAHVNLHIGDGVFTLHGDRLHLASVVYNLLDNALKYSLSSPHVAVNMRRAGDHIILEVSDSGQGIPAAYLPKIFDKFFRVPTGNVHNIKGHGLGLSYVAGVIRQHDGQIRVESREGTGTTFEIELPC